MHIDRCYCYQKSFATLRDAARETGATTVEELQEAVVFGHNCELCHPYVRRMLNTGETVFTTVLTDADAPA